MERENLWRRKYKVKELRVHTIYARGENSKKYIYKIDFQTFLNIFKHFDTIYFGGENSKKYILKIDLTFKLC